MSDRPARRIRWTAASIAAVLVACGAARAQSNRWQLSGYDKNLLIRSETVHGEPFTLDLNRLRLELKATPAPPITLDLQYDNELLLGNYLRTLQFQQGKDLAPPQFWRAEANYLERASAYGRHRLHRATVNLSSGDFDLRVGRQRIAWGTGRFFSPLDLLNPVSPIALERDERLGVDAVLIERKFGPLSRASAVYAPQRDASRSSRAVLWHSNVHAADYSLVGGRLLGEDVLGADLASQIGSAGIRMEATLNRPPGKARYARVMAGVDYAFGNTLTLSAEVYHNGAGASDPAAYDVQSFLAGRTQSLGRRYLGLYARYELTPLLEWKNFAVLNMADRSRYVASSLSYSVRPSLDVALGIQRFSGAAGTEYRRLPNTVHASMQWFF